MDILSVLFSVISLLFGLSAGETSIREIAPTPEIPAQKTVEYKSTVYAYSMLGPVKQVSLYSNLPTKKTSQELKEEHSCRYLVNGGFYTKESRHIGLFLTHGIVRHEQLNSSLFNAFFVKPKTGDIIISNVLPDTELSFALQSGPQLLDTGKLRTLQLTADETARRMIAGVDNNGRLYFFSVYLPTNMYSGPLLADLPEIVERIIRTENIDVVDAINLDGGNHSVFYGVDVILHELSPVGSIFCIN